MTTKTKKTATKATATKATANGESRPRKTIAKAQIRILRALAKLPPTGSLNTVTLAERADVPKSHVTGFAHVQYSTKPYPALEEQGLVKSVKEAGPDGGRAERLYHIPDKGRKFLKNLPKE
jgi:hypothetical protein